MGFWETVLAVFIGTLPLTWIVSVASDQNFLGFCNKIDALDLKFSQIEDRLDALPTSHELFSALRG